MSPGLTHRRGIPIRHPCNWVSLPSPFVLPFRPLVQFLKLRESSWRGVQLSRAGKCAPGAGLLLHSYPVAAHLYTKKSAARACEDIRSTVHWTHHPLRY
jgi:hypothetical protein